MHLKKPQSTQKNKTFVIVSLSSRSLAESATKTNNHVIGLDIFNDLDLLKATKKASAKRLVPKKIAINMSLT